MPLQKLQEIVDKIRSSNDYNSFHQEFKDEFRKVMEEHNFDWFEEQLEYLGSGSYCGKNWRIDFTNSYSFRNSLYFELEVDFKNYSLKVYNGNHQGFWSPEFLSTGDKEYIDFLKNKFRKILEID